VQTPSSKYRFMCCEQTNDVLNFIQRVITNNYNASPLPNLQLQSETFTLVLTVNINLQLFCEAGRDEMSQPLNYLVNYVTLFPSHNVVVSRENMKSS
jgi:hypothetical protein